MILGTDIKKNKEVEVSTQSSRVVLITGKRGSGKSYTLGGLAEELYQRALLPVVDPLGIFWTFCLPSVRCWVRCVDHKPASGVGELTAPSTTRRLPHTENSEGLPTTVLVPGDPVLRYGADVFEKKLKLGVEFRPLRLNPSDISPSGWCQLFDLIISEPQGIALFRAVQSLAENHYFPIDELIEAVMEDARPQDKTKEALLNRLEMAKAWDIFSSSYEEVWEKLDLNSINVLDLSVLDPGGYGLANLIVSVLCRDLFVKRVKKNSNLIFPLLFSFYHRFLTICPIPIVIGIDRLRSFASDCFVLLCFVPRNSSQRRLQPWLDTDSSFLRKVGDLKDGFREAL